MKRGEIGLSKWIIKNSFSHCATCEDYKLDEEIKDKKDLEKIVLCDVQIEIYPDLEKSLLNLLHNSGYPGIKFEKRVDFEKLYNQRFN